MPHALIIEDNLVVSKLLESRLAELGYASFDHAWTEEDAVAAAAQRRPDLVLVGDSLEKGSGIDAARQICARDDIPVLLVTGDSLKAKAPPAADARIEGPFMLGELDRAVERAQEEFVAAE